MPSPVCDSFYVTIQTKHNGKITWNNRKCTGWEITDVRYSTRTSIGASHTRVSVSYIPDDGVRLIRLNLWFNGYRMSIDTLFSSTYFVVRVIGASAWCMCERVCVQIQWLFWKLYFGNQLFGPFAACSLLFAFDLFSFTRTLSPWMMSRAFHLIFHPITFARINEQKHHT